MIVSRFTRGTPTHAGAFDEDEVIPGLDPVTATGPFDLPPGAEVERDVPYGADAAHRLDVYRPRRADPAPVILMAHGGGWARGDKAQWRVVRHKVTHWVGKGYVFVSINHRLLPAADPLTQAEDVARALAFIQRGARAFGGDPTRLVLMGHSAGAHLMALLTVDSTIPQRHGAAPWLATVALDSGALDVEEIMRGRHLPLYDRAFRRDPAYWREASPTHRLRGPLAAPMLIVCSTRRWDACEQGAALAAKARAYGGRVDLCPVDLAHGAVNGLLGVPGSYTEAVDAFLRSVGLP